MILFFNEDIDFQLLRKNSWKKWIKEVIHQYTEKVGELNYIFCSDEHLLSINQQYLNHDYFTDIITFPSAFSEDKISGDLFISVDRVKEHSKENHCSFMEELKRVMIHGVLHLLGYGDKTETDAKIMRELENKAMILFHVKHEEEYFKWGVSRETK